MSTAKRPPASPAATETTPPSALPSRAIKKAAGRAIVRRRRTRSRPEHGWGLIGRAAERLGLSNGLHERLACRAFAVALHRLLPRLEPQARAEQLQSATLHIRVSSSAVASELSYVKDVLLEQVNAQLGQLAKETAPRPSRRRGSKPTASNTTGTPGTPGLGTAAKGSAAPIERLAFRVGPIKALPAYADWLTYTPRPRLPPPPRPAWDLGVASQVAHVTDSDLRSALQALYSAATQGPAPTPPTVGKNRPPTRG